MAVISKIGTSYPDPQNDYEKALIEQNLQYDEMFNKYGFNTLINDEAFGRLHKDLVRALANSNIPEERKRALVTQINGYLSSLPQKSFMDDWSEAIIGTSNYLQTMNTVSGNIGEAIAAMTNDSYQENYDSAVQSAARLEQAGVNTDFTGLDSGQAADTNEMKSSYEAPASMDGSLSSGILSTMTQVGNGLMAGVIGIVDKVFDWKGKDIANAISDITFDKAAMEHVSESLGRSFDSDHPDFGFITDTLKQFGYDGPDLKSMEELDNFIEKYNKSDKIKAESDKLTVDRIFENHVLDKALKINSPWLSRSAQKRFNAWKSTLKDSNYVKGLAKKYENAYRSNNLESRRIAAITKGLGEDFQKLASDAYNSAMKAEEQYNKWYADYYSKMNQSQSYTDSSGNEVTGNVNSAEVSARFAKACAEKKASIVEELKSDLEESTKEFQKQINDLVDNSWLLKDNIAGGILKLLVPTLMSIISNGANAAVQSWGSNFFAPPPAPRVTNFDTQKYTTVTNNYGQ